MFTERERIELVAQTARQVAIQDTIQKHLDHIQRLRPGQAKRHYKRHQARYWALTKARQELTRQGAWLSNPAFIDVQAREERLSNATLSQLVFHRNSKFTREEAIEWQMGFARTVVTQAERDQALAPRTRPVQEAPVKPERKYVSVRKADILGLAAAIHEQRLSDGLELLKKLTKAAAQA